MIFFFFFFQAEDGIRDSSVTGVQTCALPISRLSGCGPFELARRSRRHLCPPNRQPLSAEIAVEQHVTAETVGAHGRAHRLVDTRDRRQRETRSSAAHDEWRDQNMQAVETTGSEEPRNRIGPALEQDAAETAREERGNDGGG